MPSAEWTVLIADDEPAARRGVRQLLAAFPHFAVVGECRDGAELLAALEVLRPDVVFLDVQMPGVDGFEVIRRRAPERMPAVVFLTAYEQYALAAFEAEAVDYLLKPVAATRFAATMRRLSRHLGRVAAVRPASLVVTSPRGALVLPLSEIDWVEASGNYARLWIGPRSHLLRESLGQLEQRIAGHGFVRAHRRALVRLAAVRELVRTSDGEVHALLGCGTRIPIARRRRSAFGAAVRAQSNA